jgi:hypothetical protein
MKLITADILVIRLMITIDVDNGPSICSTLSVNERRIIVTWKHMGFSSATSSIADAADHHQFG